MRDPTGPDVREGPVPLDAVLTLLGLLDAQGLAWRAQPWLSALLAPPVCADHMRAFKLDVSLDLHPQAAPRVSINDTGEPVAFRRRLLAACGPMGLEPRQLESFFALSAPGAAQTTASLKWEPSGLRVGLYFEELHRHPDPHGLRARVCDWAGLPRPAAREGLLGSVCVDLRAGALSGYKEYYIVDLNDDISLHPGLRAYARRLPPHPSTGCRRALVATRFSAAGALCGHKLLWVTEATRPSFATWAWSTVFSMHGALGLDGGDNLARARRLAQAWPWSAACYVYPDLVSLNVDANGQPERLLVYVSVK